MGNIRRIVRRESREPVADFVQRVRAGMFGAILILVLTGVARWITH